MDRRAAERDIGCPCHLIFAHVCCPFCSIRPWDTTGSRRPQRSRACAASRLVVNFFQPSFTLASKTRVGAKVHQTDHAPQPPYSKLRALPTVSDEMKERLRAVAVQLDPLQRLEEIRSVQHHLADLAAGQPLHLAPRQDGSLDEFLSGWPPRGSTAKSAPRIGSCLAPRMIGGRARIRLRPPGPLCALGSRPSPIASGAISLNASSTNSRRLPGRATAHLPAPGPRVATSGGAPTRIRIAVAGRGVETGDARGATRSTAHTRGSGAQKRRPHE